MLKYELVFVNFIRNVRLSDQVFRIGSKKDSIIITIIITIIMTIIIIVINISIFMIVINMKITIPPTVIGLRNSYFH